MKATVQWIYHSGILVETEHRAFLFDYFEGELPKIEKPLSVFISHFHKDHFNPEVYRLNAEHFFVSKDVAKRSDWEGLTVLAPGDRATLDDLEVLAFDSTDCGNSFLVRADGMSLFFAADLNRWIWEEDTEAERREMQRRFTAALKEVSKHEVDLGLFPLDPRLEAEAAVGTQEFLDLVRPKYFLPIHYWDKIAEKDALLPRLNLGDAVLLNPTKRNHRFEITLGE